MTCVSDPKPTIAPAGRRRILLPLALAALLGVLLLLGLSPWFVEQVWARSVAPILSIALGRASGLLPFSLADVVLVGVPLVLLALTVRGIRRVVRERAWRGSVLQGGARLLRWMVAGALLFYATFGLGYGSRPLAARHGWPTVSAAANRTAQAEELEALCRAAVEAANASYRAATGSDDAGEPSSWPGSRAELEHALDAGLGEAGAELGLDGWFAVARGRSKRPLLSPLMSKLGISGFYFPWTGEANVNAQTPGAELVHVTAHEKAHQRGIVREDEAEFVAFVAGVRAPHPYARYAAHRFASEILLRELGRVDAAGAARLRAEQSPGVQRDHRASVEFWRRQRGPLTTVAVTINDSYIKAHGDVRGVRAYGAVAELLVRYARLRGGRLP